MMAMLANPLIFPITPTEISYASGSFPVERAGSPSGQSTRSRRSNRSSSDADPVLAWDGFIEEDLRAGGPRLCEPPCETIHRLPETYPHFHALTSQPEHSLYREIMEIGRQAHLDILELSFCGRRSVFQRDQSPCLTALLLARRSNLSERGWIHIARRIREHLHHKGINQITVEIIDPRFGQRPRLFPCFPDDAIFPIWGRVGRTVLDVLDLTGIWTIGCYRIGISEDRHECPPTILLGVGRKTIRNWKDAREAMVTILDSFRLFMVGVLIRKDTSVFRVDSQSTSAPASAGNFTKEVHLGYSISPNKIKHGHGTFGGWIELRNPQSGEWVPFGITCSHSVFPPDEDLPPEEVPVFQECVRNGVAFMDKNSPQMLIVDSPSRQDVKRAIKNLAEEIDEIENSSEYQKVEKAKAEGDFVIPFEERRWKIASDSLKALKEQRHISKEFFHSNSFVFGSVVAASGLKENPMETVIVRDPNASLTIIDWALVRPQNRNLSVGTNNVPESPSRSFSKLGGFFYDRIQIDARLFKVGRATGFTEGIYGGLRTIHVATRLVDGREEKIETWEHTMLARSIKESVVEQGDSGSLVFDRYGFVVGMVFGGSFTGDAGYFTHAADLIKDIQDVTGVREIRLKGEAS